MSVNGQHDRQSDHDRRDLREIFTTPGLVDAAMRKATRQALRRHKLLGESVAVSRDGKVVILSPEEIPDFPEDETLPPR
jgi:hypothetical protein